MFDLFERSRLVVEDQVLDFIRNNAPHTFRFLQVFVDSQKKVRKWNFYKETTSHYNLLSEKKRVH